VTKAAENEVPEFFCTPLVGGEQDQVDAGGGNRDMRAAIGERRQLVVAISRGDGDDVGVGRGNSGGELAPLLPAAATMMTFLA